MSKAPSAAKKVSLAEIYPLIREILDSGGSFSIGVTGNSMFPTLVPGRDSVTISRPSSPLKRNDLPLYRRDNGSFILHRILSVQPDGSFVCCGDHQWVKETGIRPDQIVGVVSQIERKGRSFPVTFFPYRFWVGLWRFLLPVRRMIFRLIGVPARIKNKFKKK